jgi:uncharacterized protein (DUF342 family)
MSELVVYSDEFVKITIENHDVLLETFQKGFPMEKLSTFLSKHPEIGLTNAAAVRNAIGTAPAKPQKIGEVKERIHLELAPSGLTATVSFNLPEEELAPASREKLLQEVNSLLSRNGIVFGVNTGPLLGELKSGIPYTIAQGIPATDGADAVIRMYELMEAKPEIRQDGSADYYDLKLINRVKPGDWLGERIEATDGAPGKTVKGEILHPVKGRTAMLDYDKNSVTEVSTAEKTVLFSRLSGAVNYTNGRISVSNHLEINGDVGVSTGNVKFDGYLTVKGTVNDGFSVQATKDIEINSELGLGSVKSIISTGGSIYIKGGISSKEIVEIQAAKDVFIKFVDNAHITCGRTAHIGYYALNSNITAKEVVFDASNGQVIGGRITAEVRVVVPLAGSEVERKTTIEVTGFHRQSYIDKLDEVFHLIGSKKVEQQKLKAAVPGGKPGPGGSGASSSGSSDMLFLLKEEIKALEEERKSIASYLKAHGDGEVSITKRVYPHCYVILKGIPAEIPYGTTAITFYTKENEIKTL